MARPQITIRNWKTGAEYGIDSVEKYEASPYFEDPEWYIAIGEGAYVLETPAVPDEAPPVQETATKPKVSKTPKSE